MVLRQVGRTLAAQRLMTLLLVAAMAVLTGACAFLDASSRYEIMAEHDQAVSAGLNVYHAHAAGDDGTGRISAALCASLNTNPSVNAAAGVFGSRAVTIVKAPGRHFSYVPVVGDITRILSAENASDYDDGFFIERRTAAEIGVSDGDNVRIRMDDGSVETATAHVVEAERGFADTPQLWSYTAPQGSLTDCYVEFVPGAMTDDEQAVGWLSAALDDGRSTISVTPMTQSDAGKLLDRYMSRPTRFLWAAGGALAFLLLFLPLVFRRHEFALYRSLGAGKNPTALIYIVANTLLTVLGHGIGLAWAMLILAWVQRTIFEPTGSAMFAMASMLTCVTLLTLGCVVLSRGSMAAYIHRQL
ncbi:hypothetical protein JS532_10315 [Bifidobacterium callimiconis]|uniref:hypothetical protein n=1 Tax=Bifidobacterium callimiconis TaxID=2306973 RepID=UPI001BDC0C31|nr:hypothetical protein [Bifidobacterium callimiconis]MBT1177938.1 hypothetical protein [Bifidobacterium callimiconis]